MDEQRREEVKRARAYLEQEGLGEPLKALDRALTNRGGALIFVLRSEDGASFVGPVLNIQSGPLGFQVVPVVTLLSVMNVALGRAIENAAEQAALHEKGLTRELFIEAIGRLTPKAGELVGVPIMGMPFDADFGKET